MEIVLLIVVVVLGVVAYRTYSTSKANREAEEAERLDAVRRVAEEDVTRLGEEVAELDVVTAGVELDQGGRQDYQRALDAYEQAKDALDRVRRPEDVRGVTEALEDGRYAAACVQARVERRPLPTRRPPCFFNPQHGPSTDDVEWAPPGGQPRPVPVCAPDAERVRAGAEPATRKVPVGAGGERRPYWEAGPAYASYSGGYFAPYAMSGLLPGILMGSLIAGSWGGGWDGDGGGSGDGGGYGGEDTGAQDAGGDHGGGDYGGDGGGFDGGDFGGGFDF